MSAKKIRSKLLSALYQNFLKPILFLFDAEFMHDLFTNVGSFLGRYAITRNLTSWFFKFSDPSLEQNILGINFRNPIGLSAGWNYTGKSTSIISAIGFGFETIGTITNNPYEGNAKPRLGRLTKSRSLLVNKGFKNLGINETLKKITGVRFEIPVGLSIGVTNTADLSNRNDAISDITKAFEAAEASGVPLGYYELNISCPNLQVKIEFYSPDSLEELLKSVTKNKLTKPLFIKMPIDKTDTEVLKMLNVIVKYPIAGVIFGNLQKNKNDPSLDQKEVARFANGNFSGKPTEKRSNELIFLAYKNFKNKLAIIGCGGVFTAEDAYKKIKLGASLIQMITGMIYQGPQVIGQINQGLAELLKRDGFTNISQAIGVDNKPPHQGF